jgi:hypothetical protein
MSTTLTLPGRPVLGAAVTFGLLYTVLGLFWLVDPGTVARALVASLLTGAGLATQIGDGAAG